MRKKPGEKDLFKLAIILKTIPGKNWNWKGMATTVVYTEMLPCHIRLLTNDVMSWISHDQTQTLFVLV